MTETATTEAATEVAEPEIRQATNTVSVPTHKIVCFDEPPKRGATWALLKNMRKTASPEEDEELARDILVNGLQSPIRISPLPKGVAPKNGEEYFVVFGSRRFKAVTKLLPEIVRRDHCEALERAYARVEKAREKGEEVKDIDVATWDAKLERALAQIPQSIDASLIDSDDPVAIAAENYRENAHRKDPHWADFADRVRDFLDAGLDDKTIAKITTKSLKHIQNLCRIATKLDPVILDHARSDTEEPRLTVTQAIRLAKYDDFETQHEQLRLLFEEPSSEEAAQVEMEASGSESGSERESDDGSTAASAIRPKPDELDAIVADINAGGYDNVMPKALPKGPPDLKRGFGLGYTEGWKEGAALGLRWASGRRKTFPKPTVTD